MKETLQKFRKTLQFAFCNFKCFTSFGSKATLLALALIVCLSNAKAADPDVTLLGSWAAVTTSTTLVKSKEAGSNRVLVVVASAEHGTVTAVTGLTVTYGGQTMVQQVQKTVGTSGTGNYSFIFTLDEAGIAAATEPGTITLTWGGATPSSGTGYTMYAGFYKNVDQTTPVTATSSSNTSSSGVISSSSVFAETGDMVLINAAASGGGATFTFASSPVFTENIKLPSSGGWGTGAVITTPGAGANVALQYTCSNTGDRLLLTSIVVNRAPVPYKVTVTPPSNGTVAFNPLPANTDSLYVEGTSVALTATPSTGFKFLSWTGDYAGFANPASVPVTKATTITANFIPEATAMYVLDTNAVNGTITLVPGGGRYKENQEVTLTASPNHEIYAFGAWSGDLTGTINPGTITMTANKVVDASFPAKPTYSITPSVITSAGINGGTITITPDPSVAPKFLLDRVVTCTAVTTLGYTFLGWSGDLSGTVAAGTMTMTADKAITATFSINTYTLTTAAVGNGTVTITPAPLADGTYIYGQTITITATPEAGYRFVNWDGSYDGTASFVVPVQGPNAVYNDAAKVASGTRTITGNFEAIPTDGSVYAPNGWVHGTVNANMAGANRMLAVMAMCENSADITKCEVTFGGQTMTLASSAYGTNGNRNYSSIFTLNDAGIASASSSEIKVTYTSTNSVTSSEQSVLSALLVNVDQTALVTGTATITNPSGSSVTNVTTPSLTVGAGAMCLVGASLSTNYVSVNNGFVKQFVKQKDATLSNWGTGLGAIKLGTGVAETVTITSASGRLGVSAAVIAKSTTPVTQYTLTTSATTGGTVTAGGNYAPDAIVGLTATPAVGYRFTGWSGGGISGTTNPIDVKMDGNKAITANFVQVFTLTKTEVNGTIAASPAPIDGKYDNGTVVTLTATPATGYSFTSWTDALTTAVSPGSITISADATIGATFVKIDVTSVALNAATATIEVGGTSTLTATVLPADALNKTVTWATDNAFIATVANGVVSGLNPGTTTITASVDDGGNVVSSTAEITVVTVPVASITLDKITETIIDGATTTLTATVTPTNATNKTLAWTSSADTVATVDASGLVTGTGPGTATITATAADGSAQFASALITVTAVPVTGVALNITADTTTFIGASIVFDETIAPANASNTKVAWTTSDAAVATVDALGIVSAVTPGTATITVTTNDGNFTASAKVIVRTVEFPVTSISLDKSTATITVDQTTTITVSYLPANANLQQVGWASSSATIASVDAVTGLITGVSVGTATITATTKDGSNISASAVITVNPVLVTGIALDKATATLSLGGTTTITATVTPANATNKAITWSTDADGVATVANGVVTGTGGGTATITATTVDGSFAASAVITVIAPTILVTDVTLDKSTATLSVGGTTTLTATIVPANASNKAVSWSTSAAGVATVANGVVTAVAPGTATITVTTVSGSKTATALITVSPIPVTSVTLDKTTATLTVGGTTTLTATVAPANATNKAISWASSAASIATVANGVVTAVAPGTATITVTTTDGSKFATALITVNAATVAVTGVTLDKGTATIKVGGTVTLTATVAPATATNKTVNWTSSKTSVATVSATGIVTAVAVGTATITATTADGAKVASAVVTVEPGTAIANLSLVKCSVYPNPVSNLLMVKGENINVVTIYNALGSLVLKTNNITEGINVSNLESGIYVINISTSFGNTTTKFVKK